MGSCTMAGWRCPPGLGRSAPCARPECLEDVDELVGAHVAEVAGFDGCRRPHGPWRVPPRRARCGVAEGVAMPTIPSRDRTEVIDEIRRYAEDRLSPEQQRLFSTFIGQYYGRIARGDLAARRVHDLYGAAMSHLTLALDRPPGIPAVRVYSPDFEAHGFGSPHTVVDIVTDDMPFVVDSVTTEVIRHGLGLHLTVRPVVPVRRDGGRLAEILDRHDP